jgi:integrase
MHVVAHVLPSWYLEAMKLTKAAIGRLELPEGKPDHTYYDSDLKGFGLRLRGGGKRSWVAVYRIGRKVRRVVVGDASAVTPEEARKRAREILARADLGEDTQAEKVAERDGSVLVVGDLIDRYIDQHVEVALRPRPKAEIRRYLRETWRSLHGDTVERVERNRIAGELATIANANGPVAANRARSALHALFVWSMRQGLSPHNPVAETAKLGRERPRDRVLNDREIGAIWHGCRDDDHGRIVRILILTGQRREEAGGMMWSEIDFRKRLWSLTSDRTKNARPHDVPLSGEVLALLSRLEKRSDRIHVFGSGEGPFSGWSRCKRRLDQRCGVSGWRLHDIRRTVVTGMAEIGIQPHVIEAAVNHVSGHKAGVAGIYNRAAYSEDKRDALEAWSRHVKSIVAAEIWEQRVACSNHATPTNKIWRLL